VPTKSNRYYDIRALATRHKIATAITAGFVATHLATMFGYWDHAFGLKVLNWNYGNGLQLLPPKASHASYVTTFLVGGAAHYMNGLCFALLFAFAVHPLIPIRNTARGNMAKGLIWGTVLAIVSASVMTPYVFESQFHLGFFSHRAGFLFVLSIFIWHWIFGATLATIYNPLPDEEVIESRVTLTKATVNGTTTDTARGRIPTGIGA
jgi:hypothetical protein